jgi:hypothetical protein
VSALLDFLAGAAVLALVVGPLVYSLSGASERRKDRAWEDAHGQPRGSLRRSRDVAEARRNLRRLERLERDAD